MKLSEKGEARVRGYLFMLGQSLRSFLPPELVRDALEELESHIRERIDDAEAEPHEHGALEKVLADVGTPLSVARAYASEMTLDEAITTGRVVPTARAFWHLATTSLLGFFPALGLLMGYLAGSAFLLIAALKPIFPDHTGLLLVDGKPRGFGVLGDLPPGSELWGGYWIIPVLLVLGLATLIVTHRCATGLLVWWRSGRQRRIETPDWGESGKDR